MQKSELPNIARNALEQGNLLDKKGGILYSSQETLKPGPVYLLGYNPGGDPEQNLTGPTLGMCADALLTRTENEYLCGKWINGRDGQPAAGQALLQRRVNALLKAIGLNTADVCASNLIFQQSKNIREISPDKANACWKVHEAIIEIIQPRLIIAIGNGYPSAYSYLRDRLKPSENTEDTDYAQHGNWKRKGFQTLIHGRNTYIAGIPHLSYYKAENKPGLIEWLKSKL